MRLRAGIEPKRLVDTEIGEWVRADLVTGPSIAWIIGRVEPRGREYVAFDLTGQHTPTLHSWVGDVLCISFGTEVVVDPTGVDEEFVDRGVYIRVPGVLTLSASASYLTVTDGRSPWKDLLDLDIATGTYVEDRSGSQALFPVWKLWGSEAERVGGVAKPLLDYSVTPPQSG